MIRPKEEPPTIRQLLKEGTDSISKVARTFSGTNKKYLLTTRKLLVLADEALERDEKRRAALETKIKARDIRIIKMATALTRLKKEYDYEEGDGCEICIVPNVHDCSDDCPWRQAAYIIHCSDDELLDALTPAMQEKEEA